MTLQYKITHVFCPLQLPDGDDHCHTNDLALSEAVYESAVDYSKYLGDSAKADWECIRKLLQNLCNAMRFHQLRENCVELQLKSMTAGDVVAYLIRAQNAAVVFRRGAKDTIAESFEVSPTTEAVMGSCGKLVCSYPGPAIAVPNEVFDDSVFRLELAHFLCEMNKDILDAVPTTRKAGSTVSEERDTAHPRYITELLTGILRSVGRPAEVQRISKRIGDDVVWRDARLPWRRSSLWLLVRVVLQTTLARNGLGVDAYKTFILFFMNGLAGEAKDSGMPDDILHWVSAKISRRLTKLGGSAPDWLSDSVLQTCTGIRSLLDSRWEEVRERDAFSPTWNPLSLNFLPDTYLSLVDSHKYISNVLNSNYAVLQPANPVTDGRSRGDLDDFLSMTSGFFQNAYEVDPRVTLYDVERVVSYGIDDWVAGVSVDEIVAECEKLELLASKYSLAARETYEGNPEDFSRMLLTVIELWVAIDKLVMRQIPMLREYSPEIPITLLERLLLRDAHDVHRLCLAYDYIRERHSLSRKGWSVFSDLANSNNFAVRYFNQDPQLKALRDHIVNAADQERREKVEELKQSNKLYYDLTRRAKGMDHDYWINRWGRQRCESYCKKCSLERQSKIEITVHEWPLPKDRFRAQIAVFELKCPLAFDMWRSATCLLLVDICSPPPEPRYPDTSLEEYSALYSYGTEHARTRVTLASETKPFVDSHYCSTSIPTEESKVCTNNGLSFYYYDKRSKVSPAEAFRAADISGPCSNQLPPGPYQNLQCYLQHTVHTSNEVLCRQADCHKDLSIHEFIAYGHLRNGPLLQWLNILREIRANTLTLRRDEVHMLFAQAASQVGPVSDDGKLVWHLELELPNFRQSLLGELETLVSTVSGNWLEGATMVTTSFLVARMLSVAFAVQDDSFQRALMLFRTVREKTFCWVLELFYKLEQTTCEVEKEQLRGRLRDSAAICRSTFDVGRDTATHVLDSPQALEILVCCAIIINNNTPPQFDSLGGVSRLLVERDCRLSWDLEELVGTMIVQGNDGINRGIKRVWPRYGRDTQCSQWQRVGEGDCSWFTTNTSSSDTQCSQRVHFDALNGTLLVDGRPMGRLPNKIRTDPMFTSLFGDQAPDVLPGDMAGMEYATRGLIEDYRVYFRMGIDGLVVRAKKADSDVFELIPPGKLSSDLPASLVENHVHWLNLTTQVLEARPIDNIWKSSADNWRLHFSPGRHSMTKGDARLFDVRSQTWRMLSERLHPLENSRNLVILLENSRTVSASLPRYGLSFFINDDQELECRHPRGMVYDECQSAGTLIGLATKLILRPKTDLADEGAQRLVLVPEADVSCGRQDNHVRVTIDTSGPARRRLRYQTFRIDTDFGCLAGNATLASNLYRAYLHALTSKPCLVDPLTRRTGTEEALSILHSAACRSFMKVDSRSVELLCCIAKLTTPRTWYPRHLTCMQTVHWPAELPVAFQHHGFYVACSSIKKIQQQLHIFHDGQSTPPFKDFPRGDDHLLRRAAVRAAVLYQPTFANPCPGGGSDSVYEARDVQRSSADELRVYSTALAVYNWSTQKRPADNIRSLIESWGETLSGVSRPSRLRYNREWLSPDLRAVWLPLYDGCRRSDKRQHRFQLIFSLPAMAYASPQLEDVVNTLLAFATMPQFEHENPPDYPDYNLSDGYAPSRHALGQLVSQREKPRQDSISPQEYWERLQQEKGEIIEKAIDAWPCMKPPPFRNFFRSEWHDTDALDVDFRELFTSCYRNMELKAHLERVELILVFYHEVTPSPVNRPLGYSFAPSNQSHHRGNGDVTLEVLFHRPAPAMPLNGAMTEDLRLKLPCDYALNHHIGSPSISQTGQVSQLIGGLRRNANSAFRDLYAKMLQESAKHLEGDVLGRLVESFKTHYEQMRTRYMSTLEFLVGHMGPQTAKERAVYQSGRWPRITAKVLLGCLASTSRILLPDDWRVCLIAFAKLALEFQRARRMLALAKNRQAEDLQKELENAGCDGWEAELHVDWLLIQLDGDFLVRRVQADVALEMIAPRSGRNTVLQLNMGEGKSSVIVPAIASVLADGNQLVRVVVPKALASQMFHLLVHRLGGLVNRRVFYLPFSRSLKIGRSEAQAIQEILEQCVRDRGILVVQPEHILSFKLLSVEKQLDDTTDIDEELLQTQRWLHSHAHDILDESDEILHVRNQLIYTVGSQRPLEGSPTRWSTTQQLLHLVKKHVPTLYAEFPPGVEYEQRHGSRAFPHIRILHRDAGDELVSRTAQDVMDGRLLNFNGTRGIEKTAIHHFITRMDVASSEVQMIRDYCGDTATWTTLLHLRGLLASGILLFALMERRWRVGYGLAPWRTMLAVPYRAKDVPAPRAEFGHPDVAILLTCLSYYYGGLDREQLGLCFERLLMLDNPDQEYESWVRDCLEVPEHLRQISGVNTQSLDQWNLHLFPLFSHNQSTIDFYLSQVVFPKEVKEFPSRLSSCGWDLAEEREHVTTGFSGTNDTRYLLPTSIIQRDLDHQRATNAKVLAYLLRPENDAYVQTSWPCGRRRTTTKFLALVAEQKPEIRVILDVGAQVLELQNNELAARWLELKSDALAAIYFSDEDELTVLSREGTTQSFLDSPYASRLEECVIYLDDAHTRGTDIKFPIGSRAAVTLGPKVTKDRLTQGCMRMRKLGHGHSVMFFAPQEVDRSIRGTARKSDGDGIHPSDILLWAMGETCIEIENSAPYWAQQGRDHSLRHSAWSKFCNGEITSQELATTWCQPDAKTLEELYAPCNPKERPLLSIPAIDQRCQELGVSSSTNLNMNEEQEREIIHEIERETQVERPPPAIPAVHRVSAEVRYFVRTGVVIPTSTAFILMFDSFRNATSFAQGESAWSQHIFATSDYCTVVQGRAGTNVGEYLRPVNWILSSRSGGSTNLVIPSPFEVNELLPEIRSSSSVRLHIYTPRTQARMLPCDDLCLYTIPRAPSYPISPASIMDQVNLFAGQLYLCDYFTYLRLCRFLCVYADDLAGVGDLEVESDGFIAPAHRPLTARSIDSFHKSPLPFLKHFINFRRRGMNFVATHMGKILDGRLLKAEDFADQQGN
ncbi:hypothetical protein PISMIDRAFT_17817 [Pisolithus microcarpus 441]|uniref:ubiquitinyl hydrolase 1 n=1 Tax=Pisolithus microcarpus 441 TaxID=765257 RepID=A0A0C9YIQ2_9AGAM|nr:hypothetical protein BKA83DRAFT_17817 [Pisolithus microcarpus]KIK13669.1 hypothetical protein PISMIDRAFT_17817 [Pisolithus microcarpus 441]